MFSQEKYFKMLYYIRKYPISILVIAIVIYLSFFKPPETEVISIPGLDKVVHMCMYMGMSGMLWIEFLRAHRRQNAPQWHAWLGAFVCPVLFSGVVELLQSYCTSYRGGDWWDFAANTTGVMLASLIGWMVQRRLGNHR
ncbi:VanZ like protein [gut metagenome]|uniref:VanZ like protein n=1 Tax=gut metagenome TaxID=749906 RepID=J9H6L1_9ZZZZ